MPKRPTLWSCLQGELRDRANSEQDCEADKFEEFECSAEMLLFEHEEGYRKLIEEAAKERCAMKAVKDAMVGEIEKAYHAEKYRVRTGVLCSEAVATLIAEYISGSANEDVKQYCYFPEELYSFAIAIRASGENWPYLVYFAAKILGWPYSWEVWHRIYGCSMQEVARPILGEFCRLRYRAFSRTLNGTFFVPTSNYPSKWDFQKIMRIGISHGGFAWFKRYLKSPLFDELHSSNWNERLSRGWSATCQCSSCSPNYFDEVSPSICWLPRKCH